MQATLVALKSRMITEKPKILVKMLTVRLSKQDSLEAIGHRL